jgi:hypothetical protein
MLLGALIVMNNAVVILIIGALVAIILLQHIWYNMED